jgi:hypothetical protein
MHDFDDLMFFLISSFDSTMFGIGNVVCKNQKQCLEAYNAIFEV